MRVIIPAAGLGSRMMPYTRYLPKAMLPVGIQTPIARLLSQLRSNNITDILIITGHQTLSLTDYVRDEFPDLNIEFVYNDRYYDMNNIYSLYLAGFYCIGDDVLIINSDLMLCAELIKRVAEELPDFVLVDKDVELTRDATKVSVTKSNYIYRISKDIDLSISHAESIGVIKLSKESAERYFLKVAQFIERGDHKVWYPYALDGLLNELRVQALFADGLTWCEIDTPNDYKRAIDLFADKGFNE
ncbi:MAG: NTP transferase domain-containing protein [Acidobacteriota bacterium]